MLAKSNQPSEHQIQTAFFKWVRLAEKVHPVLKLIFAVPNAGKRSYRTASMMISEGLRSGVCDVIVPVSRHGFCGLAIEFKVAGGDARKKLTENQDEFIAGLTKENWLVSVLTDSEEAIRIVKNYLDIP